MMRRITREMRMKMIRRLRSIPLDTDYFGVDGDWGIGGTPCDVEWRRIPTENLGPQLLDA